tara:strand:+ start:1688 stop:2479 length:792 start_codon:yes stop_codon:yes gene_type:complete
MKHKIELQDASFFTKIVNGELVSFKKDEDEFIHQKGNKGWRNSDDEMFPIIGPTSKNDFIVSTKKGDAILDQHGLLRELEYSLVSSDKNSVCFTKIYKKNTLIKNSKFPKKSSKEHVFWTYDFIFKKKFTLKNNVLKIDFIIESEKGMPFMLGYHPAFLLSGSGVETLNTASEKINLEDVLSVGANAYPVLNTNKIVLNTVDRGNVEISTTGFHNFMLWTEVNNMICIEPITHYTSFIDHKHLGKNMQLSEGKNSFSVEIKIL